MRTLALLILLLITAPITRAQDEWPPDPGDIFAEGVEVVSMEYRVWSPVQVDEENRIVRVFNSETGQWQEYPFNPEIESLGHGYQYAFDNENTILFNDWFLEGTNLLEFNSNSWLFDLTTGEFSRPPRICGHYVPVLEENAAWILYTDPQTNHRTLCNSSTGEM